MPEEGETGYIAPEKWVVQKYIERPLLVRNKKFDIRQWVLVTAIAPLTVWFYRRAYLRFAGTDFRLDNLSDQFGHLCNNSIQQCADNFLEAEADMEGWMWTNEQFVEHCVTSYPGMEEVESIWEDRLIPQMQEQAISALMCASDEVAHRKNSFEMFG